MADETATCKICGNEQPVTVARDQAWRLKADSFVADVCSSCVGMLALDKLDREMRGDG